MVCSSSVIIGPLLTIPISYIVDFEQCGKLEGVQGKEKVWRDSHYRFWGLAEECRKR